MVSVIYASALALLICWLSLNVIKKRWKNRVSLGDGGSEELKTAIAAQSNATEYIPIALLLLFFLEYNGANIWLIHAFGVALLSGRVIHALCLLASNLKGRILGMQITIFSIIGLAALNFIYVPYDQLFNL